MEEEKHDDQASQAGTCEVGEVYSVNAIRNGDKTDPDTQGAEKKRDKDGEAEIKEIDDFLRMPDNHQRIERNDPIQIDVHPDRYDEKEGADEKHEGQSVDQSLFKKHNTCAACPEAEEGDADDEICEMVPVLNGEHLNKEDLIGNEGGRYEEDGNLNACE